MQEKIKTFSKIRVNLEGTIPFKKIRITLNKKPTISLIMKTIYEDKLGYISYTLVDSIVPSPKKKKLVELLSSVDESYKLGLKEYTEFIKGVKNTINNQEDLETDRGYQYLFAKLELLYKIIFGVLDKIGKIEGKEKIKIDESKRNLENIKLDYIG